MPDTYCTNCGKKLKEDSVFCPDCGINVKQSGVTSNSNRKLSVNNNHKKSSILGNFGIIAIIACISVIFVSSFAFGSIINSNYLSNGQNVQSSSSNSSNGQNVQNSYAQEQAAQNYAEAKSDLYSQMYEHQAEVEAENNRIQEHIADEKAKSFNYMGASDDEDT